MNNSYRQERIKLTLLYFTIILFTVTVFSVIVIHTQNEQFRRFDRFREVIPPRERISEDSERVEALVAEIKSENLKAIVGLDLLILTLSSLLSYYLSGRTMDPILQTLNKQKRFVSDASHELKTPLTNMKTEAEVLNRSKKADIDDYRDFTKNIIDDVDHLNNLVTYLLDTARLESSSFQVKKEPINIANLSKRVARKFNETARSRDIIIEFGAESKEIIAITNESLLQRLVSIILDNAIKYNKKNGKVLVKIYTTNSKLPVIDVEDTGVGISEDKIPYIFDRFYRVSEDRNEKGFGLGLSIAKQLAKQMNIDIDVRSKLGEGTTFSMTFR